MLFVSGYQDTEGFRDFLLETGAVALGKPFDINVLRMMVRRLLGGT